MRLDTLRPIETPEGVLLELRVAGPWSRGLALAIDQMIRTTVLGFASAPLMFLGDAGVGLFLLLAFAMEWLYPVFFELRAGGVTPGKTAMGLAVVMADGTPVTPAASLLRNLLRFADLLPMGFLLGLLTMTFDRSFRRLGDLAAGTVVVHRERRRPVGRLPEARPVAVPTALLPEEQRAIVAFAHRTPTWSTERAEELAATVPQLAGSPPSEGVRRLHGMARWLQGERS